MNCRRFPDSAGFSLVELLVTMIVISLVIMAATTTFIVQNKMATIQAATSDVQLTGQLTMDLLSRDIRMAGYGVDKTAALYGPPFDPLVSPPAPSPFAAGSFTAAANSDPLRSMGSTAILMCYSTPVLSSAPAGTRGSRRYYYYIDKTDDGGLVRRDLVSGSVEPIASNVENMQVVVTYDAASPSTGPRQVDLSLTLKSTARDNQLSGDQYRRRIYRATITPRNYGL